MDPDRIEKALRHYESMRRASSAYYERKRQGKIADGTYKGRGRPKKPSAIFQLLPIVETTNIGE
jgi:hypothetical protein